MAVIYLPEDKRAALMGEALGKLGGNVAQGAVDAQAQKAVMEVLQNGGDAQAIAKATQGSPAAMNYVKDILGLQRTGQELRMGEYELGAKPKRDARADAREQRLEDQGNVANRIRQDKVDIDRKKYELMLETEPQKKAKLDAEIRALTARTAKDNAIIAGERLTQQLMTGYLQQNYPELLTGMPEGKSPPMSVQGGGVGTTGPRAAKPGQRSEATPPTGTTPPETLAQSETTPLDPKAGNQLYGYLVKFARGDDFYGQGFRQLVADSRANPQLAESLTALNTEAQRGADAFTRAAGEGEVKPTENAEERPGIRIGKGNFSMNLPAKKAQPKAKLDDYEVNFLVNSKFLVDNLSRVRDLVAENPDLVGPLNQFFTKGSLYLPGNPGDPQAELVTRLEHNILAGIKSLGSTRAGVQMADRIKGILPSLGKDQHTFLTTTDVALDLLKTQVEGKMELYKTNNQAYSEPYMKSIIDGAAPVIYMEGPEGLRAMKEVKVGDKTYPADRIKKKADELHVTPQAIVDKLRENAQKGGSL